MKALDETIRQVINREVEINESTISNLGNPTNNVTRNGIYLAQHIRHEGWEFYELSKNWSKEKSKLKRGDFVFKVLID